ncbi:hypothetical protein LTR66_011906 [Elasticomyces elasticus]|nr:hypothetical protein LTR66_011906 [Elasticomyces elasticus]
MEQHDKAPKWGLEILRKGVDPSLEYDVSIVAVHGLGANPAWAWVRKTNVNGEEILVRWLQDEDMLPSKIHNARIMTFNYPSKWHSNAPYQRRSLCAEDLLGALVNLRKDVCKLALSRGLRRS